MAGWLSLNRQAAYLAQVSLSTQGCRLVCWVSRVLAPPSAGTQRCSRWLCSDVASFAVFWFITLTVFLSSSSFARQLGRAAPTQNPSVHHQHHPYHHHRLSSSSQWPRSDQRRKVDNPEKSRACDEQRRVAVQHSDKRRKRDGQTRHSIDCPQTRNHVSVGRLNLSPSVEGRTVFFIIG